MATYSECLGCCAKVHQVVDEVVSLREGDLKDEERKGKITGSLSTAAMDLLRLVSAYEKLHHDLNGRLTRSTDFLKNLKRKQVEYAQIRRRTEVSKKQIAAVKAFNFDIGVLELGEENSPPAEDSAMSEEGVDSEVLAHRRTMKRLDAEFTNRKALADEVDKKKQQESLYQSTVIEKRQKYDEIAQSFGPIYRAAVKASALVEAQPLILKDRAKEAARVLPRPLYNLFYALFAYCESQKAAKEPGAHILAHPQICTDETEKSGRVGDMATDHPADPHYLKTALSGRANPLATCDLCFSYIPSLQCVCLRVDAESPNVRRIGVALYEKDVGLTSPNNGLGFQEVKDGADSETSSDLGEMLASYVYGRPYIWLQGLSGLPCLPVPGVDSPREGARLIKDAVSRLAERLHWWVRFDSELKDLQALKCKVDQPHPLFNNPCLPPTELVCFEAADAAVWKDFKGVELDKGAPERMQQSSQSRVEELDSDSEKETQKRERKRRRRGHKEKEKEKSKKTPEAPHSALTAVPEISDDSQGMFYLQGAVKSMSDLVSFCVQVSPFPAVPPAFRVTCQSSFAESFQTTNFTWELQEDLDMIVQDLNCNSEAIAFGSEGRVDRLLTVLVMQLRHAVSLLGIRRCDPGSEGTAFPLLKPQGGRWVRGRNRKLPLRLWADGCTLKYVT